METYVWSKKLFVNQIFKQLVKNSQPDKYTLMKDKKI